MCDASKRCWVFPYCGCKMSLEGDHCGECGMDPCECVVQDSPVGMKGEKRPYFTIDGDEEIVEHNKGYQAAFKRALMCDEEYDQDPDLGIYFGTFNLSPEQQIAMCRTYANYLTQKLRSSGRLGPARKTSNKKN